MHSIAQQQSKTYSTQSASDLSTNSTDTAKTKHRTEQQRNLCLIDTFNVWRQQVGVYFTANTSSPINMQHKCLLQKPITVSHLAKTAPVHQKKTYCAPVTSKFFHFFNASFYIVTSAKTADLVLKLINFTLVLLV